MPNSLELLQNLPYQEPNTLHEEILAGIDQALYHVPHAKIHWPASTITAEDKLKITDQKSILQTLRKTNLDPDLKPLFADHIDFQIVRTLTFSDGETSGLVSSFVRNAADRISDQEKSIMLQNMGYLYVENEKERGELSSKGIKVVNKKNINRLKFGGQSGVDLTQIGCNPGYVGPWSRQENLHNFFFLRYPQVDHPSYAPIYDFALSEQDSVWLFDPDDTIFLAEVVAAAIGGPDPVRIVVNGE